MKTLLKTVLMTAIVIAVAGSVVAGESWKPNGSVTVSMSDQFISPTMSTVRDVPYYFVDLWVNLPAGFAVQATEYVGLNDGDLDSDKNDEFDLAAWKKFSPSPDIYVKLRAKYVDLMPVSDVNGDDLLAYDIYVGRTRNWDGPNTVTAELRLQYWHYGRDFSEGGILVMPSLTHEYKAGKFTAYDRVGLLWNQESTPFGEMLNVQPSAGIKVKLSPSLTWNIIDVTGVLPITEVKDGDPRTDGKVALTTAVTLRR